MTDVFLQEWKYLKNVSPATLELYKHSFQAFAGAMDNKTDLVARIAKLRDGGLSAVSVNTYVRHLNTYFKWLHTEHGKELVHLGKLKEEQKIIHTLTPQQTSQLLAYKPKGYYEARVYTASCVILDCGLRASEVLALKRTDIDFDDLTIKVKGKGSKYRLVPMSLDLRRILFKYLQKHKQELVFGTQQDGVVGLRNFERDFLRWNQKLKITGVRFSPHTLRHTHAVSYIRAGGNLFYLSRILGHTDIKTTQRYLLSLGVEDLTAVHSKFSLLSAKG